MSEEKLFSTWFMCQTGVVGQEKRIEWSGIASSREHAFSKMICDTTVQMPLLASFGDELYQAGSDLFLWIESEVNN